MNKKNLATILFFISALLSSCGNDTIDRQMAEEILRDVYNFPISFTADFFEGEVYLDNSPFGDTLIKKNLKIDIMGSIKKLVEAGLIEIKSIKSTGALIGPKYKINLKITNKGNNYVEKIKNIEGIPVKVIKLYKVDICEILGIRNNEKDKVAFAEVKLCLKDVTPFGKILRELKINKYPKRRNVAFVLYDDGWRVVKDEFRDWP